MGDAQYDPQDLDRLLAGCRSAEPDERLASIAALGGTSNARVQAEFARLLSEDTNPAVRAAAAESLPGVAADPAAAAAALLGALSDQDELVRAEAADALGPLGQRSAAPALAALLDHEDSAVVRAGAVESLGDLRAAAQLDQVAVAGRTDSDEAVRAYAAATLGLLAATDDILRAAHNDEVSPWVRAELTLARYRQGLVAAPTAAALLSDADRDLAERILNGLLDLVTRGDVRYPRADVDTIVNALVDLAERLPDIRTHALGVADAWRRTNP